MPIYRVSFLFADFLCGDDPVESRQILRRLHGTEAAAVQQQIFHRILLVVADFQQCTSINGAVVTLSIPETGYVFDGQAKEPRVASVILSGTTISPSNYEVSYSENINAGTATVTVTGLRNYTGTASAEFTIAPKSLSDDMIWSEGEWFIYDGEAKTLADGMFGLYDEETEQSLEYDKDYSIVYANNINVGTATATVTGNGNYQGTLVHSFEIVRELNISFSETNEWAT